MFNSENVMSDRFNKINILFHTPSENDLTATVYSLIDFNNVNTRDIKKLNDWLRLHGDKYKSETIILYHGTNADFDIAGQGLKKTKGSTRRSMQSTSGFVYLSLYPESAKTFGEFAYPKAKIAVYAVKILVSSLMADLDQLNNKRMWSDGISEIKNTLADSLVYGSGGRVKRDVPPFDVRDITNIINNVS